MSQNPSLLSDGVRPPSQPSKDLSEESEAHVMLQKVLETESNKAGGQSRNLGQAKALRGSAGAKGQAKLFKTQWENVKEKQRRTFSIVNHDEYGDKGKRGTLDEDVVKPTNAKVPKLNLNNLGTTSPYPLTADSRNIDSHGVRLVLSQDNIDLISTQKRQKHALRQALHAQDSARNFTCTLARFRTEANRLGVTLSAADYEVIFNAFKVLKNIGYGG